MKISVVIPTFNRCRLLSDTIPALLNQQTDGAGYEVIFVSNGSTDDTEKVLNDAVARHPDVIRYVRIEPTGGPSAPRNVGIRAATGDVVIILDDDVLPDPELVLSHARFHKAHPDPEYAATGEVYVPEHLRTDPMSLFHTFPYDEVRELERLSYLHFWTCNVSFKRSFMLTAGMFDESFLYYEDVECARRMADSGLHLKFLPSARGQHLHQLKPAGIPSKGVFTGRWLYRFVQRYPEREVMERFGVLSPALGLLSFTRRLVKRILFWLIDNPLTMGCLRVLGATRGPRTRLGDFYYFIVFRRNVVAGYAQARREDRAAKHIDVKEATSEWVNRGES